MDTANLTLADFSRPEILSNPYPAYAALRQNDPIHRDPDAGGWIVTHHADVAAVLGDRRFSARRNAGAAGASPTNPIEQALSQQMLFQDPPSHTRLRALFTKAFTPHRVEQLRPQISLVVDDLLDKAVAESGRS